MAGAATAAGLPLDVPCAVPESQPSQDLPEEGSQEQQGGKQGTTFLSLMLEVGTMHCHYGWLFVKARAGLSLIDNITPMLTFKLC